MCEQQRRGFLKRMAVGAGAILGVSLMGLASAQTPDASGKKWVCPPCGCGQDHKEFDAAGLCPVCGMPLVEKVAGGPSPPDPHDHPEPRKDQPAGVSTPATPSSAPPVSSPRPE